MLGRKRGIGATEHRKQKQRGKGECTWCGGSVPKPRRHWCSDECLEQFRLHHDWKYIRFKAIERDNHCCRMCGFDARQFQRIMSEAGRQLRELSPGLWWRWNEEVLRTLGFNDPLILLEADHIMPVALGGTDHIDNVQALCVPCHKEKTAAEAARNAKIRRIKKKPGRYGKVKAH